MTEIAARAGAPIGSLYQFFPSKQALADTLVRSYVGLLVADLEGLATRAASLSATALIAALFGLFRAHPPERATVHELAQWMEEGSRRRKFRQVLRRHVATILRARLPGLRAERARHMALVIWQLAKSAHALGEEPALPGRATAAAELQGLAARYLAEHDAP